MIEIWCWTFLKLSLKTLWGRNSRVILSWLEKIRPRIRQVTRSFFPRLHGILTKIHINNNIWHNQILHISQTNHLFCDLSICIPKIPLSKLLKYISPCLLHKKKDSLLRSIKLNFSVYFSSHSVSLQLWWGDYTKTPCHYSHSIFCYHPEVQFSVLLNIETDFCDPRRLEFLLSRKNFSRHLSGCIYNGLMKTLNSWNY